MALKILFICNKSPWPPKEGGSKAMNQLIEGLLQKDNIVKVLAVDSYKYHVDTNEIPPLYLQKTGIEFIHLNLRLQIIPALWNWLLNRSYHIQRFISSRFNQKLIEILKQQTFDIIQLETLFMSPYLETIRKYSNAKIVLRAHNIEHLIWKRIFEQEKKGLKRIYLSYLYKSLEKYERSILNSFDGILPISEKDAGFFRDNTIIPVKSLPFGLTVPDFSENSPTGSNKTIVHIGAMNWMPNEEGIRWFLYEVWPLLLEKVPDTKLRLAGREMPEWLLNFKENGVEILGEVDDATLFLRSGNISIAPLFSGSGIRIKILESMSMGMAVVSTSIGAEGIDYQAGKNILIADTAIEFANTLHFLLESPEEASQIGLHARQLIAEKYNTGSVIRQLITFYKEIL